MSGTKKYGLLLSENKKPKPIFKATHNVFGEDSDSDKESSKKQVFYAATQSKLKQAKSAQNKAILEDPTVYQYDEIYDSMTSKKAEIITKNKEEKKPKYIENLMKSANKRKIENERRIERQIQKEREQEGDEFVDKEVFVTSAYKKKLQELQIEEEKEKREEYLESIGDVTKQKDLGGFYRHLYEQKLGPKTNVENQEKEELEEKNHHTAEKKVEKTTSEKKGKLSSKRNYRKRNTSDMNNLQLSEGEIEDSDEEVNRANLHNMIGVKKIKPDQNLDADSDFSIDESSDEDSNEDAKAAAQETVAEPPATTSKSKNATEDKQEELKRDEKTPPLELKPKVDPWKKRTVGEAFDQALKRYYERKASRGC